MSKRFEGKVAIVTGGAQGIGLATAKRFAADGARVVLADYDAAKAAASAEALKADGAADAWGAACDVSKEDQVEACCQGAVDRFGSVDIVVNNAGLMTFSLIVDTTAADFLRVLGVDLMGAFFFTKHAFRRMKPGGAIVNVASVHAVETSPLAAPLRGGQGGGAVAYPHRLHRGQAHGPAGQRRAAGRGEHPHAVGQSQREVGRRKPSTRPTWANRRIWRR